ncbi:MAG TPA: galactose-1-phosphate uridylyltransferase [Candidatus Acidoferrales bacterium]|nr:galactose-1-phosphate uridylyltransferase [Candidatus Acidoferrales bacterium]
MAELRQNVLTREWVIISPERAKRPDEFARRKENEQALPDYVSTCPFCAGNEHLTLNELLRAPDNGDWKVRVIPNKFPALTSRGERVRRVEGIYRSMTAVGFHEVIVEHRLHNRTIALMTDGEVSEVLKVYRQRYNEIRKDGRIEAVILFKNHGEGAGTSVSHPHSQLVATPIVPSQIRSRMDEAIRYFDDMGECVCCRTVKDELNAKGRIILQNKNFVAFIPYAALSPFHIWIFPLRHVSSFHEINDDEIKDLSKCLRIVLAKLYHGLNDPDFNYSIRSIPTRDLHSEYFHWYLTIVPRVSKTAGFEIGSGMYVNTSVPEESADFLRKVNVPE